jgi:hypothetical protein
MPVSGFWFLVSRLLIVLLALKPPNRRRPSGESPLFHTFLDTDSSMVQGGGI